MIACLLLACGDDKVVNESEDRIPPAQITDLVVVDTSTTTATLVWTAVGDDSLTGRAAAYDVRYSTSAITDSTWPLAFQCTGEPSPKDAGAIDTFIVTGLEPATVYYFAVKALDEANNFPHISNLVSQMTTPSNYVTWERVYMNSGEVFSNPAVVAFDGGYVVGGRTDNPASFGSDAHLYKVDDFGNIVWQRTYGGPFDEHMRFLLRTPDGGYLLAGDAGIPDPADDTLSIYFVKTDVSGNLEWETWYQRQVWTEIDALNLAHGGGYVAAGGSINEYVTTEIHNYALILKLSEAGNVEWWQPLDDTLDMRSYNPRDIFATPDGGYLVLDSHLRLIKTDGLGVVLWVKDLREQLPNMSRHRGHRIRTCGSGGAVIIGAVRPDGTGEDDLRDICLFRLDAAFDVRWYKRFGGPYYDNGYAVVVFPDGYLIAGHVQTSADPKGNIYLAKTDLDGELIWERSYGDHGSESAWTVEVAPDGGFIVGAGRSYGPGTGVYYVIKTDPRGEL